jgi:hypothetical protein
MSEVPGGLCPALDLLRALLEDDILSMGRAMRSQLLAFGACALSLTACETATAQPETVRARALGCLASQTYNTQSADRYSMLFVIVDSAGERHRFNFEARTIQRITGPVPLSSTAETLQWERIMETIERAGMAERPIMVDYTTPDNKVFGITVQWETRCPAR